MTGRIKKVFGIFFKIIILLNIIRFFLYLEYRMLMMLPYLGPIFVEK